MDRMTRGLIENIGGEWKEIGKKERQENKKL